MNDFWCPDVSKSRSRRGKVAGVFSERFFDDLLRIVLTYFDCAVFTRPRWDTVFYDSLCTSVLRRRHKYQFVFRLFFVYFLNFLVVLRCKNWKKHWNSSSAVKFACRCHFGAPRTDFLPLGRVFWTPFVGPEAPQGLLGVPRLPPKLPKLGSRRQAGKNLPRSFLRSGLQSPRGTHLGVIFYDFLWFSMVLPGKSPISKKKHNFYLHNSHVRCLLCR